MATAEKRLEATQTQAYFDTKQHSDEPAAQQQQQQQQQQQPGTLPGFCAFAGLSHRSSSYSPANAYRSTPNPHPQTHTLSTTPQILEEDAANVPDQAAQVGSGWWMGRGVVHGLHGFAWVGGLHVVQVLY